MINQIKAWLEQVNWSHLMENKRNAWLLLCAGLVVGLLCLWVVFKIVKPVAKAVCVYIIESDEDARSGKAVRSVSVEAEAVKLGTMTRRITTVGKLNANAIVTIRSEIYGRIKELLASEGSAVQKGQPIIQFEDADATAELKQAEAEFVLKKADFERFEKLHGKSIGSAKDLDRARAEKDIAEAKLEAARSKVDKTKILAPFEGTLGLISLSPGAYVQANQEIVTIVDNTPIKIEFKVPEKHIHDVGAGQQAEIQIDAFKDKTFLATVDAVDAQVESESHSIAIKASVPNESGLLKAGMFANISLIIGEKGNTIMVDEAAVDRDGEIEYVWVVEKGKAARRRVLTGVREKGSIEIVAGLRPGQLVVTAGQIKLADGVRVKIMNMWAGDVEKKQKEASETDDQEDEETSEQDTSKKDKALKEKKSEAKESKSSSTSKSDELPKSENKKADLKKAS